MRKIIAWSLFVGMVLALLTGCEKNRNQDQIIETHPTIHTTEIEQESSKDATEKQTEVTEPEQVEPETTAATEPEQVEPETTTATETETAPEETAQPKQEAHDSTKPVSTEPADSNSQNYELPEEEL